MPLTDSPLQLDKADLFSPRVESYLEERAALRKAMPETQQQPLIVRVIYSNFFYLSLAGALGAVVAWLILEPFFDDFRINQESFDLAGILLFPTVAGFIGLFLGAVEGIMCRNAQRASISALVGLGVGFGGGLLALIPAGMVFSFGVQIALAVSKAQPDEMPTGIGFLLLMMGRAAAWSLASIPAGLGQGIALREKKVLQNGILGGVLGRLIGGMLFDPIYMAFTTAAGEASVSRLIGFVFIGLLVGLFVGLVEQWTKSAWLLMRAGPLAGKQFVLYKNPTVLGSSPKADVYLFKDDAIEPKHALIHNRGGRFELEDLGTPDGTYVNGIPVRTQILKAGDQIVLGKTVLEFALKES